MTLPHSARLVTLTGILTAVLFGGWLAMEWRWHALVQAITAVAAQCEEQEARPCR